MRFGVLFLILFLSPFLNLRAQISLKETNTGSFEYINSYKLHEKLIAEAERIIKHGHSISPTKASKKLSQVIGDKVIINRVNQREKPLSSVDLFDKVRKSTIVLAIAHHHKQSGATHVSTASGFVISASGICVTNYHVIKGYTDISLKASLQIRTYDGRVYPVTKVLSTSKKNDIAILKVELNGDKLTPLPLGNAAQVGSKVYVISHPRGIFYYLSTGIVAGNYYKNIKNRSKPGNEFRMVITADYAGGSSGAPIVNKYGNLVGIVSSTRSIYYHPKERNNLQMVINNTIPVFDLKKLIIFNN